MEAASNDTSVAVPVSSFASPNLAGNTDRHSMDSVVLSRPRSDRVTPHRRSWRNAPLDRITAQVQPPHLNAAAAAAGPLNLGHRLFNLKPGLPFYRHPSCPLLPLIKTFLILHHSYISLYTPLPDHQIP